MKRPHVENLRLFDKYKGRSLSLLTMILDRVLLVSLLLLALITAYEYYKKDQTKTQRIIDKVINESITQDQLVDTPLRVPEKKTIKTPQ